MEANTQISQLEVSAISPSNFNPRKNFTQADIQELADSIRNVGLLQPITVRPFDGGHQIVCGERRWRAAVAAGLETIPVIVREMSDRIALDLAITENLQRVDIDPFEEGGAYEVLLGRGDTLDDIATRFAKSSLYVRGRVKLGNMIVPLRKLYNEKAIKVSHCLELCKLDKTLQIEIYTKHYEDKDDHWSWRDHSVKELKDDIEDMFEALEEIDFDKSECIKCPQNTAVTCMFPELEKIGCMDKECFKKKKQQYRIDTIMRVYEQEPNCALYSYSAYSADDKAILEHLKESKVPYLTDSDCGWRIWPKQPEKSSWDTDDSHAKSVATYENDLADIDKKINNGYYRKAFVVTGHYFGDYFLVYARGGKDVDISSPEKMRISELREKDKRNAELRIEKAIAECRKLMESDKVAGEAALSDIERGLAVYIMTGYDGRRKMIKKTVVETLACLTSIPEKESDAAFRRYIRENLTNYGSDINSQLWIEFAREHFPDQVKAIEEKLSETYLRRKEKIDAEIANLETREKENKASSGKKK